MNKNWQFKCRLLSRCCSDSE